MSLVAVISHTLATATSSTLLLSAAIILSTFILEDATTVVVGLLVADGMIAIPVALGSLYAGIVIGDLGFYFLGYLASRHPRLAQYVDHDFIAPFRLWLETRYILTIFSARFIPGSRLPTYTASGFFRSPLSTFVLTAIVATSVWTTVLFFGSYWFGSATASIMGTLRYGIALVFLIALFLIARRNLLSYRQSKVAIRISDDTHTK